MTLVQLLLNLLFAFLAFFVVRYIGSLVAPEGADKVKIINVVAVIVAIIVFFADLAAQVTLK